MVEDEEINDYEATCPYCEHKCMDSHEIFDEAYSEKTICDNCEKEFYVTQDIDVTYTTRKTL